MRVVSYSVRFEQWVPVPLAEVFAFFSNPANLPRIMPPDLDARLVGLEIVPVAGAERGRGDHPPFAGVGSEIAVSIRVFPFLPLRAPWIARITSFEMNRHFADVQAKGPFRRFEHRHEFEAATRSGREGTIVRDLVEYDIGFGILGGLLQGAFVGRRMRKTFAHRQKTLERLLSGVGRKGK
jgi:ligand-binding SRPBCC domain-containing protein